MKNISEIKGKLPLLLIFAILVLCAGFLIMSCGDPQRKTKDTNKGAYAIDFSLCPASACTAHPAGNDGNPVLDIGRREVTMEAWVMSKVATSTSGTIFKRSDGSRGVELTITNNVPKFTIRRVPGVTGTEAYSVDSGFTLVENTWHHIAGVIANIIHSHTPTSTAMTQKPHLDIYIDGEFKNSATTNFNFADNPADEAMVIGPLNDAVIDELRFWVTERTDTDIKNCMNKELGIGGDCDRGDLDLAAYYRLNEGEGADVTDFSGNGFAGAFEYGLGNAVFVPWENGWVAGNPNLQRAD